MSSWIIPALVTLSAVALALPVGLYLAWVFDGRYRAPRWLAFLERLVNTGPMGWKAYALTLLGFSAVCFVLNVACLAAQPSLPLNPEGKQELAASTVFNTACSFITNTNLQHYAGEVHFSYFSQLVFVVWNMFAAAAVGLAASVAVVRGLRGDADVGNFYLDVWRGIVYVLMPPSLLTGVVLIACGVPMTFAPAAQASTIGANAMGEGQAQVVSRGPVAAVLPIKHLGTNGGGFFGANSAHPYENPNAISNYVENVSILVLSLGTVVMFGRMLRKPAEAAVIFGVMLTLFVVMLGWAVVQEDRPNPAFAGLPVDQSAGNLEGKELRFGPSASATWVASTTATWCGAVNCMHDSLNPLTQVTPLSGMWLLCVVGGKGVGLINFLVYLLVAVFFAGLMVGRTPEYLGKKVEAREMKLAMLALLIHPVLILGPTAVGCVSEWGKGATSNPGAHGFTQIAYEFSSSAANNGSGMEGLGDTHGFADATEPAPHALAWDVSTGVVMLLGRFVPIIAPLALAGSLAKKRRVPFTVGTLRTGTVTFGVVVLGTILLVGALLFMPAAMLGPVAEHLAPIGR